jgi:transporter family protein
VPKWLLYSILAFVVFGVWAVLPKAVNTQFSPLTMQLIATIGVLPMAALFAASPNLRSGGNLPRGIAYAFVTGVFGNSGNIALLEALNHGGSASIVYPLTGMFPLVTLLLARLWLKERPNTVQIIGVGVSLVAIYLFSTSPDISTPDAISTATRTAAISWMGYSLIALLLFGVCGVTQKLASTDISTELSTICWAAGSIPVAAAIFWMQPPGPNIAKRDWIISILWGVLVVLGMLASFAAYRRGKASVVTALTALYPALTVVLAIFLFDEHLDAWKFAAILLALLAGVALSYEKAIG